MFLDHGGPATTAAHPCCTRARNQEPGDLPDGGDVASGPDAFRSYRLSGTHMVTQAFDHCRGQRNFVSISPVPGLFFPHRAHARWSRSSELTMQPSKALATIYDPEHPSANTTVKAPDKRLRVCELTVFTPCTNTLFGF